MTCGRESMASKALKDFNDAIDAADAAGSFGAGLLAKMGMIWCVVHSPLGCTRTHARIQAASPVCGRAHAHTRATDAAASLLARS